ncbi:helix-turn-helix domain-containing protein [Halorubrum ejinorense]|uniref:HTH bat-type domain-containing protein n=1 Tax=Halorubrum ejinorense TaxID=425309 RepID=A0AAV3SQR5_9EURY
MTITNVIRYAILSICWNIRPCYRRWPVSSFVGFIPALKGGAFSLHFRNNVRLARNIDVGPISNEEAIHYHALRSELTKQQLAAFEAALELGYYAGDDQATISDIAAFLDVHHSTAGEHIKRAENTPLSEVGRHMFPDVVNQGTQPETLRSDPSEC